MNFGQKYESYWEESKSELMEEQIFKILISFFFFILNLCIYWTVSSQFLLLSIWFKKLHPSVQLYS